MVFKPISGKRVVGLIEQTPELSLYVFMYLFFLSVYKGAMITQALDYTYPELFVARATLINPRTSTLELSSSNHMPFSTFSCSANPKVSSDLNHVDFNQ